MRTTTGRGSTWRAEPRLRDILRHRPGLRLPATGLVLDALVPAVLEQRVTGHDARRAWRLLLRRFGRPAPGPATDLRVPPSARDLLDDPDLGLAPPRRGRAAAAGRSGPRPPSHRGWRSAPRLDSAAALARLRVVPGVGEWTAAETAQRALGHPDAVSVGDYHIKDQVVYFLTGRPRGDDAEMLRLLEPWAGQRQRVVRLIELSGVGKPRFGPRFAPVDIRAI